MSQRRSAFVRSLAIAALLCPLASRAELRSTCKESSWVGGVTEVCDGKFVYRDYVYDDYGANSDQAQRGQTPGSLSPSAGDERYPAGQESTADLVKLTIEVSATELVATFTLNALFDPASTIAALAIDTDDDAATGGGDWSGLGIRSDGWEVFAKFAAGQPGTTVDPDANTIVGRIPRPAGTTWRVQAATAQSDGTVMNVAFRGTDEQAGGPASLSTGTWWEDRQAAALAAGDVSAFGAEVDVADLAPGVTKLTEFPAGFHQRVYVSDYTLAPGEGTNLAGVPGKTTTSPMNICPQYFHYVGKYQPYGVYIPDHSEMPAATKYGIQFALHGCNANHASLVNGDGMQTRFGIERNRIVAVPLGRGPIGWYSDISERDVLDVLADLHDSYPIDDEQVFMGGYSMGGYGTLRLSELYPDLFAGAVNWVGFTGDEGNLPGVGTLEFYQGGAIGNVIDFVGNLRHVPMVSLYSGADELVHIHTSLAMAEAFRNADGVPYELYEHPAAEHLTYAVLDDWTKEAEFTDGLTLVHDPARVTFKTDLWFAYPEYGIRHDHAYWISGIDQNQEGPITVDLTSRGCGKPLPTHTTGADAGVGPAVLPWVAEYRRISGQTNVTPLRRIEGTLANASRLTIDVDRACLSDGPVDYEITTDGNVTVQLSDGRFVTLGGGPEPQTGTIP